MGGLPLTSFPSFLSALSYSHGQCRHYQDLRCTAVRRACFYWVRSFISSPDQQLKREQTLGHRVHPVLPVFQTVLCRRLLAEHRRSIALVHPFPLVKHDVNTDIDPVPLGHLTSLICRLSVRPSGSTLSSTGVTRPYSTTSAGMCCYTYKPPTPSTKAAAAGQSQCVFQFHLQCPHLLTRRQISVALTVRAKLYLAANKVVLTGNLRRALLR